MKQLDRVRNFVLGELANNNRETFAFLPISVVVPDISSVLVKH